MSYALRVRFATMARVATRACRFVDLTCCRRCACTSPTRSDTRTARRRFPSSPSRQRSHSNCWWRRISSTAEPTHRRFRNFVNNLNIHVSFATASAESSACFCFFHSRTFSLLKFMKYCHGYFSCVPFLLQFPKRPSKIIRHSMSYRQSLRRMRWNNFAQ